VLLPEKLRPFADDPLFRRLTASDREFLVRKTSELQLSHQQIKQLLDITADLAMWDEGPLREHWDEAGLEKMKGKDRSARAVERIRAKWRQLREMPPAYREFQGGPPPKNQLTYRSAGPGDALLGRCPVASPKTRCCNLLTLDAVQQCGFACSYCSIQSFYGNGEVFFHQELPRKLAALELYPGRLYHIGTGQSSDSLMWGNRDGLLDALFDFAAANPNVILELKTKSDKTAPLLEREVPRNVVATWSLNPETIVEQEEHLTASAERRLAAARRTADAGIPVGFHFHPIIRYEGWREEYDALWKRVQELFSPRETVMVSFGTLTFTKEVVKLLRRQPVRSKVLQLPLHDAAGKLSYPYEIKRELFSRAYAAFGPAWKREVFFYLCMEDPELWEPVFGFSYADNEEFETAMKEAYARKMGLPIPYRVCPPGS
jgi:spore photoproduct lyase